MEKLYSWGTSLPEKIDNSEYAEFFKDYIFGSHICTKIFVTGLIIALITTILFYFVVCNKWFRLAKRWIWLVVGLCTISICTAVNYHQIMGEMDENGGKSRGIYAWSEETQETLLKSAGTNTAVITQIVELSENYRASLQSGEETLPWELARFNQLYTSIWFVLLSFLFKNHTIHGKAVPLP